MSANLPFYLVEAALLACIATFSLGLASQGLRRLGAPIRFRHRRVLLASWLVFAVIGSVFGEAVGPEFVLPHQFCFWLALGGASLWLFSFVRRRPPDRTPARAHGHARD